MKIYTLGEDPKVIFSNEKAANKNVLMRDALADGIHDFSNADLSLFDLSNIEFKHCNFMGANLYKAKLERTLFENCNMQNIRLVYCNTYQARIRSCNLDGGTFDQTHMGNVEMFMCTLDKANIVNLGMTARGYMVVMSFENGRAIIRAGCQELTLEEAKERYPEKENTEEGARVTLARRIAFQRGWLHKAHAVEVVAPQEIVEEIIEEKPQGEDIPVEAVPAIESLKEAIEKVTEEVKETEVAQTVNA